MRKLLSSVVTGTLSLGIVAAVISVQAAAGGMIVYDPNNYAENLLQATRALDQLRTMTRQLEAELRMVQGLGTTKRADIQNVMGRMESLLYQTDGLGFDLDRIGGDFKELYPEEYNSADYRRIVAQAERWTAQNRAAVRESMGTTSLAAENLARHDQRLQELLAASDSAAGTTAAVQAGNQILASLGAQIADMNALIIAQNRAVDSRAAEEAARKAQQNALHIQLWQGVGDVTVERPAIDTSPTTTTIH
jgi:P-type conjugative transfer protein TrbJ